MQKTNSMLEVSLYEVVVVTIQIGSMAYLALWFLLFSAFPGCTVVHSEPNRAIAIMEFTVCSSGVVWTVIDFWDKCEQNRIKRKKKETEEKVK